MSNVVIFRSPNEQIENDKDGTYELIPGFVIHSRQMKNLAREIELLAACDTTIHIHGESGTGKELVAKSLHKLSGRRNKPFIAANCSTFTPELANSELFGHEKGSFTGATEKRIGLFEEAQGGTVFLDEVSQLPLSQQAKLLRTLEERTITRVGSNHPINIDVRIISASNDNLLTLVGTGVFREDLYYRLNIVDLKIPALRDRREDIPILIDHFRRQIDREACFDDTFIYRMQRLQWKGNVRELRNTIERMIRLKQANIIGRDMPEDQYMGPLDMETVEREHYYRVLKLNHGNKTRAAKDLKVSLKTLHNKINRWEKEKKSNQTDQ